MTCINIKCVICGHQWQAPLTSEMPMCPKCMGPVTADRIETKPQAKRGAKHEG